MSAPTTSAPAVTSAPDPERRSPMALVRDAVTRRAGDGAPVAVDDVATECGLPATLVSAIVTHLGRLGAVRVVSAETVCSGMSCVGCGSAGRCGTA